MKSSNTGFMLIELLVAIIIGVLSTIALPDFFNQANKARVSEAKTIVDIQLILIECFTE